MTELIFVRHGETDSNTRGLLHGRTDIPLSPIGRKQAAQVAHRIHQLGNIRSVYTSPLQRAEATANEIGQRLGLEPIIDANLVEFDFGDLEGLSFDDLQLNHPDLYLSLIEPDRFGVPFPNGESRSRLHARVTEAMHQILEQNRSGRAVIVAHLVVIGTAVAHLTSGDQQDAVNYLVRNCSITHLELNGTGPPTMYCLDDTSHLL